MVSDQAACEKAGGVWVSDGQGGGFCYMKLEGEDIEVEEIPNPDLDWDPFGSSNSSSAHGSDLYVRKRPGRSSDGGGRFDMEYVGEMEYGGLHVKSGAVDHNSTRSNRGVSGDGGSGGTGDAKSGAVDHNSTRSNRGVSGDGGGTGGSTAKHGLEMGVRKRPGRTSFGPLITKSGK
ncbi:MAG: hypothetical protein VW551_03480, partial [Euryarchaeota archaeon]